MFVDLTTAYDIVWHRDLTSKLLRLLPDRHMVHVIMAMGSNRSFTLTTGNRKRSRLRRLKNGIPQGSLLAPLLFNIYISDVPTTVSRKDAYADNLAIMHADGDGQAVEGVLSKDMATIDEYLQTWKLKLSTTKTVSAAFHLNNKEAKRELKVNFNNGNLRFCSEPKYLEVTLDRTLTYRRHLESNFAESWHHASHSLRWLAGSGWSAGATTLRIAQPWSFQQQSTALVPQCSYPPRWPCHQRRLANCDWMPASYTSRQSSYPRGHPTRWASSQRSHTVSGTMCHGAWTSVPCQRSLSIEWECTAPQIETPFVPAAQQLISLSDNKQGGSPVECGVSGWTTPQDSVLEPPLPDIGTTPPGFALLRTTRSG